MARYNEYMGAEDGVSKSATREYAVANSVTVTVGDLVYLTGGRVSNASIAGKRLIGQVIGVQSNDLDRDYATTAAGNSGGTVKVLVRVEKDARYLLLSDETGANLAATDIGKVFDLTGATGAQRVDVSTGAANTGPASGQVVYVGNANGVRGTDATYGIFMIAEHQHSADDPGAS